MNLLLQIRDSTLVINNTFKNVETRVWQFNLRPSAFIIFPTEYISSVRTKLVVTTAV